MQEMPHDNRPLSPRRDAMSPHDASVTGSQGSPQTLTTAVCCSPQDSFNLLVATALWAEMRIDPAVCARMSSSLPPALSPDHRRPHLTAPRPSRRAE